MALPQPTHHSPALRAPRDRARRRCVNYLNPHLNIGLPLFTIHGNHDDPSGQDNTSAVDLLSSTGLLNYFGKVVRGVRCWRACARACALRAAGGGSGHRRAICDARMPACTHQTHAHTQLLAGNSIGKIQLTPVLIQKVCVTARLTPLVSILLVSIWMLWWHRRLLAAPQARHKPGLLVAPTTTTHVRALLRMRMRMHGVPCAGRHACRAVRPGQCEG
jgi:hypothetical protein